MTQTAHLHDDARVVLSEWVAPDQGQEQLRSQYLAFLDEHDDAMQRSCTVGHLTASALMIDQAHERVLLTLHPKVGRWLQLGGHVEPDDHSLREAAAREAREESGIATGVVSTAPLRLDRHPVPCGGQMSEHLDVQYLVIVPNGSVEVMSDESDDLRWFDVRRLPDGLDASVLALVDAALANTR